MLRDERTDTDTRHLEAYLTANGDLEIEGVDRGDEVERLLGGREYEWIWTVRSVHIGRLQVALGGTSSVLAGLKAQFSGENAASLGDFLTQNAIPYEVWSRIGD